MSDESSPAEPGSRTSLAEVQRRVEEFWDRAQVRSKLMAGRTGGPVFRFTEGPPTANGAPHVGHVLSRTLKDVVLRYRRMRGDFIVTPMAGWDCHGLPVELEIEKKHGLKSKKEIEAFGVERFCDECRASTLSVAAVWEEMSRRVGFWLDYDRPYLTMDPNYIESVWWSLRQFFDRGLLQKGYYVLPYCPRCETPLSSHEVAQGYREVVDPSITVRFRLVRNPGETPRYLLVWTTTPWTLPANLLIAARKDLTYDVVRKSDGTEYVLGAGARARYDTELAGADVAHLTGAELEGTEYEPLFPFAGPGPHRYRVVLDSMVDDTEGTGLVHIAPSFGPDDLRIGTREAVGQFDPLDSRGVFTDRVPFLLGRFFKSADKLVTEGLAKAGALVRTETLEHTYPFCWRCGTPLIYRAVDSWFVRVSRFSDELIRNNQQAKWLPAHLRDGRFGNFLEEAKDWALSRNRYWGTPLPVWVCPQGHATCIGSFAELAERSGAPLPVPFDPHRVTVDRIVVTCSTCGGPAQREPYTIDGWYDSGSAPFAQYHYPFEPGPFIPSEPLDFVAEGLDQTRGWFYTLLVLATGLFHRLAYRVSVPNGLVLDERGLKMSKSVGNVTDPLELLRRHGGDVVRWTFLSLDYSEPLRVQDSTFRLGGSRVLGTLLNIVEFWRQNARPDDLAGEMALPAVTQAIDRWLLSRLDATVVEVTDALQTYELRRGVTALSTLIDDLSTWYLRRNRPRFWAEEVTQDRQEANATLSFALATVARLAAPFAPFAAESVFQALRAESPSRAEDSVHAQSWPEALLVRDLPLESRMVEVRRLAEVGRELRQRAGVKSRIPLEELLVSAPEEAMPSTALDADALRLLADELNVRSVRFAPGEELTRLSDSDWVVRVEGGRPVAALARRPSPELRREGLVREALRRLQSVRKEMQLAYTEHVDLTVYASTEWLEALTPATDRLRREVLVDVLSLQPAPAPAGADARRFELDREVLDVILRRKEPDP